MGRNSAAAFYGEIKVYKILFVCHGNICRSPMAEFMFKKMVSQAGRKDEFLIESAAVSTEEIGHDMYPPACKKLSEKNVPFSPRRARQITVGDYENFDLLIGMDVKNLFYMQRLWNKDPKNKVKLLLSYAGKDRDIADPWYTGDFEKTWLDLEEGLSALLKSF